MDAVVVWIKIERFYHSITLTQTNMHENTHIQPNSTKNMLDLEAKL